MANTYTALYNHVVFSYGAFTMSKSNLPEVIQYIESQREHHHKKTFQEEYLDFLKSHGVDYDERYVWG